MIYLKEILNRPESGKPFAKIVYRGDDEAFAEFDPNMIGRNGYETVGFWFTGTKDAAEFYGEHVRPFKITMNNPLVFTSEDFRKGYPDGPPKFAKLAKNKGHDGAVILNIMDGNMCSDVYCVFDNKNIRTITPT